MNSLSYLLGLPKVSVSFFPANGNQGEGTMTFTDGYSGANLMDTNQGMVPQCDDDLVVVNPNGVLSLEVHDDVMYSDSENSETTTEPVFDNGFELVNDE